MQHTFFIMLGVSGSGKSTIIQELIKDDRIVYVPSYATREPRPGEENGKPYRFIKPEQFMQSIDTNEFLEYAFVHQTSYYGTKRSDVQSIMDQGKFPLKEVDMQGFINIKNIPDLQWTIVSIFLDVDDATMRQRIISRNAWTPEEEILHRIHSAQHERQEANKRCDHIIDATQDVQTVIANVTAIVTRYMS